jgi:hypothetical protein
MLHQILDFFASLLIHNYREIFCVKFWTFFAPLLIHSYKDLYCVKFWTFLLHF